jgi:hypothetical protein
MSHCTAQPGRPQSPEDSKELAESDMATVARIHATIFLARRAAIFKVHQGDIFGDQHP